MPSERVYRFLVTSGDQTSAAREFQHTVRSHAATVSRPGQRRQACTRRRNDGEGVIVFESTTVRQYHRILPRTTSTSELAVRTRHSQSARRIQATQSAQPTRRAQSEQTSDRPANADIPQSQHRLRVDYLSGDTFSPLQHLPTFNAPYLPGIINHYIHNLMIPIPELDGSATVPLFRTVWLPIVFHDPVVFQVIVLFAATHYATFADPSRYNSLYSELLALKHFALVALIQTVQVSQVTLHGYANETRNSKDILIAAAAKMASYEAIWGTTEAVSPPTSFAIRRDHKTNILTQHHLHMSTVRRLLRQQGGPDTLGMDGFLARLLTFVDTNSAFLLGTDLYLEEFGLSSRMPKPRCYPPRFESVENAAEAQVQAGNTSIINLERFMGLMSLGTGSN